MNSSCKISKDNNRKQLEEIKEREQAKWLSSSRQHGFLSFQSALCSKRGSICSGGRTKTLMNIFNSSNTCTTANDMSPTEKQPMSSQSIENIKMQNNKDTLKYNIFRRQLNEVITPSSFDSLLNQQSKVSALQSKNTVLPFAITDRFKQMNRTDCLNNASQIFSLNNSFRSKTIKQMKHSNKLKNEDEPQYFNSTSHSNNLSGLQNKIINIANNHKLPYQQLRVNINHKNHQLSQEKLNLPIQQQISVIDNNKQIDEKKQIDENKQNLDKQIAKAHISQFSPKVLFEKAQIFQSKQEVITKEVRIYDDSLQIQLKSQRGQKKFEQIQLPFYRKKLVVVVSDQNQDCRSKSLTTKERLIQDSYKMAKKNQEEIVYQKIDQNIKENQEEMVQQQSKRKQTLDNINQNQHQIYKNCLKLPLDQNQTISDRHINQLLQNQSEIIHIQKESNLSQIKQRFQAIQSDNKMESINSSNRYQTNCFSQFIIQKQ